MELVGLTWVVEAGDESTQLQVSQSALTQLHLHTVAEHKFESFVV